MPSVRQVSGPFAPGATRLLLPQFNVANQVENVLNGRRVRRAKRSIRRGLIFIDMQG